MKTRFWLHPLTLLALACSGDAGPTSEIPTERVEVALREVAAGLESPVHLTAPAGDPRQFVVEQPGRIRVIGSDELRSTPFLDITEKVGSGGERGLLSVAFHPDYARNGYFFVNYTDRSGDTQIERYRVSADPNRADPGSARRILAVDQPYPNHNGGLVAFGPDGMLYIGMGDGGSGGDPQGNGQKLTTLLGKMLRIDVDRADPYGIPADNPYVGRADARGEIWAVGLRNPWRFAFDRTAGVLYVADVGQSQWEEINAVPAAAPGLNYGWNPMEGAHCFRAESCDRTGLVIPVQEYGHAEGCSITGGHVYRGSAIRTLAGHYFYGDFCQGWIRSFRYVDGRATDERSWNLGPLESVLSIGEDAAGELYVLSGDGRVYRFVPE